MRLPPATKLLPWAGAALLTGVAIASLIAARTYYIEAKVARVATAAPPSISYPVGWDQAQAQVLIVGDSRVARWRPRPEVSGVAFALAGVGGETSRELAARIGDTVEQAAPDVVVISTGINDLVAASLAAKQAPAIMAELASNIAKAGMTAKAAEAETIYMTILRPADPGLMRRAFAWSDRIHDLVRSTNREILALAASDGASAIDADKLFPGDGALPDAFSEDALHWTPAAYEVLNRALAEKLAPR